MFKVGDRVKFIGSIPAWYGRVGNVRSVSCDITPHDVVEQYDVDFDDGSSFRGIPDRDLMAHTSDVNDALRYSVSAISTQDVSVFPWANIPMDFAFTKKPAPAPKTDLREQRKKDGCCLECGEKGHIDPRTFHMICSKHGVY